MKILFLDQTGNLGGAELCLLDIAKYYGDACLVGLFTDGVFRQRLEQAKIPVRVLSEQSLKVRKDSSFLHSLGSFWRLVPLIQQVIYLSQDYDLIYANTQKALVVGAIASYFGCRPLVYHLHDILSQEHFSRSNLRLAVTLANQFASRIIANSQATQQAFVAAGGRAELTTVVYNGFALESDVAPSMNSSEQISVERPAALENLKHAGKFVVGHFSRLAPWKGQHILLTALTHCPEEVMAIFVGDALFGEEAYVQQLHQQVKQLGLQQRVQFLGFQTNISALMTACDLITHTSTAPEPFGRVIVEAMLCRRPVIAAAAGGAIELITHNQTGWLTPPGDSLQLAAAIQNCRDHPDHSQTIAVHAQQVARQRFHLTVTNQQIAQLLQQIPQRSTSQVTME
ncbi:glycosyltransferase [Phormidesmis sp. 146-33]